MAKHDGRFIWRETMTQDAGKTKAFYGGLFGWSFEDRPMGEMGTYTIIHREKGDAMGIGGIMQAGPQQKQIPTHWVSYASVPSVDASIAAAKANGGDAPWGPMDVPNVGRMAGIMAFDKAMLAVMTPEGPDQAPPARPPVGAFCWETLSTSDVDRAKKFWTAVCPWKASTGAGMPTFSVGEGMENQVADIQTAQGPVPPNWLTFVVVEKIEPSCDKAGALGGKVMMPAMAVPGIGRIAVILDPLGAALGLFEPGGI